MTPYGAKGTGVAPLVGVAPCLANAIYNAIGIRFTEIPITPESVLKAIKRKAREERLAETISPARQV